MRWLRWGPKMLLLTLILCLFSISCVTNAVRSVADGHFIAQSSGFSLNVKPKGLILPPPPTVLSQGFHV